MEGPPLAGIRILDLTQALAGPFASMILGDLGAEVIKVEAAGGDLTRTSPPHYVDGTSVYFLTNNRNKQGIVLDLKSDAGRAALHDLARISDVIVYNFSAGVVERLKIDPDTLRAINPRAVVCNMTGYGRHGPQFGRRAVDLIVQSLAGAMSITGEPGGKPVRAGVPTADLATGLYAVIGILAALQARNARGTGALVETSLFHSQLSLLNYVATYAMFAGKSPGPVGSGHPGTVPSQAFQTADGWITIDAGFNHHFEALCHVAGRDDLAADARFKDRPSRNLHRDSLIPELQAALLTKPSAAWLAALDEAKVPAGPVNSVLDALDDVQAREYGAVREVTFAGKPVKVPTTPIWFDGQVGHPMRSPPALGQDSASVLGRLLGYDESQIHAAVTGRSEIPAGQASAR
ncbi:MAG: CoA transferase [Alphaproteobacteria bacterium]|nr:CoA transferase [Alphaproteobacteria bacterium]